MIKFILVVLFSLSASQALSETCLQNSQQLTRSDELKQQLNLFGGLEELVGQYKLRGVAGFFAPTLVEFKVADEVFWVSINKDKFKQVHLCLESDNLRVHVLQPRRPENGKILIRKGSKANSLLISAHRSGWKFMKFEKIQMAQELALTDHAVEIE